MSKQLIGSLIDGKYRVLERLGAGGAGTVYKALQEDLQRTVAIKILHADDASIAENQARFRQEARLLAELKHENIVGIYSYGILEDNSPYMVMEYLKGETLAQQLAREERFEQKKTLHVAIQICQAMNCANQLGVVHRDLKPQNIMLIERGGQKDFIKILDFGLSKLLGSESSQVHTQTGALVGSPHYMSPEAGTGQGADQRSDIYSLACILYECISGKPPFEADSAIGMLYQHRSQMPAPLHDSSPNSDLSRELELIIFKCLQKDPHDRFQTFEELGNALDLLRQGFLEELNDSLNKIVVSKRIPRQKQRLRKPAFLFGAAILLITAIAVFVFSFQDQWKCIQAELALSSHPSKETQLYWLSQADQLDKSSKLLAAKQIRQAVLNQLPKGEIAILTLYTEHAKARLAAGDKDNAIKWASYCLSEISKNKSLLKRIPEESVIRIIKESSRIMMTCSPKLDKKQKDAILALIRNHVCDKPVSGLVDFYKLALRLSQEIGLYQAKDCAPALDLLETFYIRNGQEKEALALSPFCGRASGIAFGKASEPAHYLRMAQEWVYAGNSKAVEYLQSLADKKMKEDPSLADSRTILIEQAGLYSVLHQTDKAISSARLAIQHSESPSDKLGHSAKLCEILIEAKRYEDAIDAAENAKSIYSEFDDAYKNRLAEFLDNVVHLEKKALLALKLESKAAEILYDHLKTLKKQEKSEGVNRSVAHTLIGLTSIHRRQKNLEAANKDIEEASAICLAHPSFGKYRVETLYFRMLGFLDRKDEKGFLQCIEQLNKESWYSILDATLPPAFYEESISRLKTTNPALLKAFLNWTMQLISAGLNDTPPRLSLVKDISTQFLSCHEYKFVSKVIKQVKALARLPAADAEWFEEAQEVCNRN